ncbi:unnamed protein product, partial [marine sediment metagenome]
MDSICQSRDSQNAKKISPFQTSPTHEESGSKVEDLHKESQPKEEAKKMKQGRHQLRWQFNSLTHNPTQPIRFSLDNGDYATNFKIESFEIIWSCMDRTTNNQNLSGDTHQVVLALTEAGASPLNIESVNNRPYAMRVADRRQIAWGQMNSNMVNTILD